MGASPFFATPTAFPNWRFENMPERDLLSVHADDFWGVPWDEFALSDAPTNLPALWLNRWNGLRDQAKASNKVLYLALSPLGDRTTLAPKVDAAGNPVAHWAPVDAAGCFAFSTDANAAKYRTAYVNYVNYLVKLLQPSFLSPGVEINIQFTRCPAEKAAFFNWYSQMHQAVKTANPALTMFPTYQLEFLYGVADVQAACPGISVAACFDQRLTEALSLPAERIAFSSYPISWKFRTEYAGNLPTDTYSKLQAKTSLPIWISETGWATVPVRATYMHGSSSTCGLEVLPASIANETEQANYLKWLLAEAQTRRFETVIWWLNRDYLDGNVAATCPCSGANDTCSLADTFYTLAGTGAEALLRSFGNMALYRYDGSARPSQAVWHDYVTRPISR